jgi:hypothetical protein
MLCISCILVLGCDDDHFTHCQGVTSKACCFLSTAEAEAPLGDSVMPGIEEDFGDYSTCTFLRKNSSSDRAVILVWYAPEKLTSPSASEIIKAINSTPAENLISRPNLSGKAIWRTLLNLQTPRSEGLYVLNGANLYALFGHQIPDQQPWLMEVELARSVQRRISKNR